MIHMNDDPVTGYAAWAITTGDRTTAVTVAYLPGDRRLPIQSTGVQQPIEIVDAGAAGIVPDGGADPSHLDDMVVMFRTGLSQAQVHRIIQGIDARHHGNVAVALTQLGQGISQSAQPDRLEIARNIAALGAMVETATEMRHAITKVVKPVPRQTAWPINLALNAVQDGPSGRNWNQDVEPGTDKHRRQGDTGYISLGEIQLPDFMLPAMRHVLANMGTSATALFQVILKMAIDNVDNRDRDVFTVDIDHLAREVYGKSHSNAEQRRAIVWDEIRLLASLRVTGPGPWMRNPIKRNGVIVAMAWDHPLITLEYALRPPEQTAVPYLIQLRASSRLAKSVTLGRRALPVIGDTSRIMQIPAGQASGSWARTISDALMLEARMQRSNILHVTRRCLLIGNPGQPHVLDLLEDRKVKRRAVEYWLGALEVIRRDLPGLIEHIDDPEVPTGRGWEHQWLDQTVTITLALDVPETQGLSKLMQDKASREASATARRRLPSKHAPKRHHH